MGYKTNLLNHARAIQTCAPRFGLKANVDLLSFRLTLTGRNRYYEFFPQFVASSRDGAMVYTQTLQETVRGFIGWLPYVHKKWPLATEKLLFKRFCIEHGLRTPRHWTEVDNSVRDAIIKQSLSSFGKGIRGPFKTVDGANAEHRLREKEYYEQFILGMIAKAWYWDDKLVCLEMFDMATVTGDGKRSMYDLIARRARKGRGRAPERADSAALAQYQGVSLDDVVAADKEIIVDFRYVSALNRKRRKGSDVSPKDAGVAAHPNNRKSSDVLPKYAGTELARQFSEAGPILWGAIPEDTRKATLWTLDAIVEEEAGRAWFLEMNCNPLVHPSVYFSMLEGLFGPADAVNPGIPLGMHPPGATLPGVPEPSTGSPTGPSRSGNGGMPPRR